MGVGWLGFAKGASKAGLDAIVAREEEDSRKKLAELQEKLRRETSEIEFKRDVRREIDREERALTKPKDNVFDPVTSKVRILDSMGRQVGERDATQAERDKYNLDMESERLGLDVKRANIRQSDAAAAASLASADYSRKAAGAVGKEGARGSLDGTGKGLTLQERVQEALYRNKELIASVTAEDGNLGRGTVEVGIEDLIRQMAARGEDPSQIDSKIRQRLLPLLKSRARSNPNLKDY